MERKQLANNAYSIRNCSNIWFFFVLKFVVFAGCKTSILDDSEFCYNIISQTIFDLDSDDICTEYEKSSYYQCSKKLKNNETTFKKLKNLTEINSSSDVLALLDNVNISLYGFICRNLSESFSNKSQYYFKTSNYSCSGSRCFFTNNPYALFPDLPTCQSCVQNTRLIRKWFSFFVLGMICLFGNGIVIYQKIAQSFKKTHRNKEIQVYNALVLSLAMADFLMGIYLVAISFEIRRKSLNRAIYFSEFRLCNALGIINFLSCQVSLSMIVLISLYRLYGVMRPYKSVKLKLSFLLITLLWIIWITASMIPLINTEALNNVFDYGLRNNQYHVNNSTIFYSEFKEILSNFRNEANSSSDLKYVLDAVTNYPTRSVVKTAMKSFNFINSDVWSPVGFYNTQFYCTMSFIITKSAVEGANAFTLSIIAFNLISCIVIIVAYIVLYISVAESKPKLFCFPMTRKRSNSNNNVIEQTQQRKAENQKLFCTITVIVLTDVVVWLAMCLISLSYWDMYSVINENSLDPYLDIYAWFQSLIFCLVPINSVLNPFIYFYHFWSNLLTKRKNWF